jgi:hypothetical protein
MTEVGSRPLMAIVDDDDELFRRSIERLLSQAGFGSRRSNRPKTSCRTATSTGRRAPFWT